MNAGALWSAAASEARRRFSTSRTHWKSLAFENKAASRFACRRTPYRNIPLVREKPNYAASIACKRTAQTILLFFKNNSC